MKNKIIDAKVTVPAISYTGTVTSKVIKNNKVLHKTVGHNNGCPNLFLALAEGLAGNPVTDRMPGKVMLYTYNNQSLANQATLSGIAYSNNIYATRAEKVEYDSLAFDGFFTAGAIASLAEVVQPISPAMSYTAIPVVTMTENGTPAVKFQFKIPYLVISEPDKIKLAVLYPNKQNITLADALAFKVLNEEDHLPPEDNKGNVYALIEWEMKLVNASSTAATNGTT